MKLPIGIVARFALKRLVLPAIVKAANDPANPLTLDTAKAALVEAAEREALRQVVKRAA
jgi:hypothetical protein